MYYVYVLKSKKTAKIYFGYTSDLRLRFKQHNRGKNISTKSGVPWESVYYESYKSKSDAQRRERMLKHDGRSLVWLKKRMRNSLL